MLVEKEYHSSVDNWSLGVLAYEFVIGRTPFRVSTKHWDDMDDSSFKKKLHEGIFGRVKDWDVDPEINEISLYNVAQGINSIPGTHSDLSSSQRQESIDEASKTGPYAEISPEYRLVIEGLLKRRPSERITVEQVNEILATIAM